MATASRNVSPGAALLRSSRLFSMPKPLPSPVDQSQATKHKSDTATAPYPTYLSVTTPHTSRLVGDWGFKRPLPLKSTTNTTIPLVRVRKVDSIEHVTDFQSASEHTITLAKFQEMHLSITQPERSRLHGRVPKSVFEETGDVTFLDSGKRAATEDVRWKFNGPWLAGLSDGEFNRYIRDVVRNKRAGFLQYLKEQYVNEKNSDAQQKTREERLPEPKPIHAADISKEEFTEHIRQLRNDRHAIFRHVSRFLDLAPVSIGSPLAQLGNINPEPASDHDNPYAERGPPRTHPSAGLSYLRTNQYLDNHPVYGPQKDHAPVKARVLAPKNNINSITNPMFGIGGFVTTVKEGETRFAKPTAYISRGMEAAKRSSIPLGILDFDAEAQTGTKVYVKPDLATVDASGKVRLKWVDPSEVSELIQQEVVGEEKVFDNAQREATAEPTTSFQRPRGMFRGSSRFGRDNGASGARNGASAGTANRGYGLGTREL